MDHARHRMLHLIFLNTTTTTGNERTVSIFGGQSPRAMIVPRIRLHIQCPLARIRLLHCTHLAQDLPGYRHPAFRVATSEVLCETLALKQREATHESVALRATETRSVAVAAATDWLLDKRGRTDRRTAHSRLTALRATRPLQGGEVIYELMAGLARSERSASAWSLQIGIDRHLDLSQSTLRHINHACEPNVRLQGLTLRARSDIQVGDELTLDYNSSELDLGGASFGCACANSSCALDGAPSITAAIISRLARRLK
eukprot:SAG11_NODE_4337_length_1943_cov_1.690347_1_plen_258_part_00